MRVNVYAEEMTDRVEIISKEIDGHVFTGLRLYLELPVTVGGHGRHRSEPEVYPPINGQPAQVSGPFIHRPGDDDSSAVTFWGKRDLRKVLYKMIAELDRHYGSPTMTLPTSDAEVAIRTQQATAGYEHKSATELASIAADLLLSASEPEPDPTPSLASLDCNCDRKGPPLFLKIGDKTNVSNHRQECPLYKYLYDKYASEK